MVNTKHTTVGIDLDDRLLRLILCRMSALGELRRSAWMSAVGGKRTLPNVATCVDLRDCRAVENGPTYRERIIIGVYVLAFAAATAFHASDIIHGGWLPYRFAPLFLNSYWTALFFLDALVVGLLLSGWLRSALSLGVTIMVTDVAANSYAFLGLGFDEFAISLQLQTAFLGFVLGSAPFLWCTSRGAGS